jgi:hypothetical protein
MWAILNRTPYGTGRNWTRDPTGMHWWLVAVRATFTVSPQGRLRLSDEQPAPALAPEHFGEPGRSSLRYDSDLLAPRPGTDVLMLAQAHAPRGQRAVSVPVVLRIASLEKQLIVHGERVYFGGLLGLTTTRPRPFASRPIQYELAYGGCDQDDPDPRQHRIDARNPVGRGFARKTARLHGQPAHAIEYPGGKPESRGPAGFGPIDPAWLPRRALAGTYDERWAQAKKPLLPEDYDPAFAMSAPADQQFDRPLSGGDRVGLLNLTPEGTLVFDLPRISLRFRTKFGRKREEHPATLATVLLEPEERRVTLVWQSALRVAAPDLDHLDSTEVTEA